MHGNGLDGSPCCIYNNVRGDERKGKQDVSQWCFGIHLRGGKSFYASISNFNLNILYNIKILMALVKNAKELFLTFLLLRLQIWKQYYLTL